MIPKIIRVAPPPPIGTYLKDAIKRRIKETKSRTTKHDMNPQCLDQE